MTANMYQSNRGNMSVVGEEIKKRLPGPITILQEEVVEPTMSDLQLMMENERKQHENAYRYEYGHNDGSAPGWESSF